MRKIFLLLLPLLISGCPMGDKVNLHPAQATIVGKKVCVFVDTNDMVREESILKVGIWRYGNDHYVYEKSYANTPVALKPGKCVPGVDEYDFIPGEGTASLLVHLCIPMKPDLSCGKKGRKSC